MVQDIVSLEELVKQLRPEEQSEVRDFAEFLVLRRKRRQGRPLQHEWAGGLRDLRDQYTAAELQEQANKWRTE